MHIMLALALLLTPSVTESLATQRAGVTLPRGLRVEGCIAVVLDVRAGRPVAVWTGEGYRLLRDRAAAAAREWRFGRATFVGSLVLCAHGR